MKVIGQQELSTLGALEASTQKMLFEKREAERKSTIIHGILTLIGSVIICTLGWVGTAFFADRPLHPILLICMVVGCVLLSAVYFHCRLARFHGYAFLANISAYPPVYQYAKYADTYDIHGYRIERRVERNSMNEDFKYYLELIVADRESQKTSFKLVGPFKLVMREDIQEATFDLQTGVLNVPYENTTSNA